MLLGLDTLTLGKEADIDRMAREWASVLKNAEARKDAEAAAKALLSQGIKLPRLLKMKLPTTTGGKYQAPMFEGDDGILYFNESLERGKGYQKYKEKKMAYKSGAQDNTFLHELGHHIDALLEPKAYSTVEHQWEMKDVDKKRIEKELSRYALQNRAEFEAELISATLRGKRFSKELLAYSRLNSPEKRKELADKLLSFASGEELSVPQEDLEIGFEDLMRVLYEEEAASLRPEILEEPGVRQFIETHAGFMNRAVDYAIEQRPLDELSVRRLKESNYVFSGYKTFHELNEAFPSLLDSDGNRKPFEQFLNDVQKVNQSYNRWYLRAEYNFAMASAGMAARWKDFERDGDDYLLQYRTVGDKRVREAHRLMHGVTLPASSRFWDWYFPPNGWNCRCTVVQVRRGKYPESDEHDAMNLGSQATAGKHQEMMRFNPGKQMACFPAYNPYTISRCKDCEYRPGKLTLARIPDNELCAACKVIREMVKAKEALKKERAEIREKSRFLTGKVLRNKDFDKDIVVSMGSIKEWLNQPHKWIRDKNALLPDMEKVMAASKYLGYGPDEHDPAITMHLFETLIHGEKSWIVVRELLDGTTKLHSVSDSKKILEFLTNKKG